MGVKSLSASSSELMLAGIAFIEALILMYTEPLSLTTAGDSILRSKPIKLCMQGVVVEHRQQTCCCTIAVT